jgi:hypothetical protein
MNTTPAFGGALARVIIIATFTDDNRGVPIMEVSVARERTQPRLRDAEQLARLLTIAPLLHALIVDATQVWPAEFDAPPDVDRSISGADLIDWFDGWRSRAKEALASARAAHIGHTVFTETQDPLPWDGDATSRTRLATPR